MIDVGAIIEANAQNIAVAQEKAKNYDDSTRIKFHFPELDKYFIGMTEGTIYVMGSPNMGKTSITENLLLRGAVKNPDVIVLDFTLDDSVEMRNYRNVGILGRVNSTSVKCPEAYPESLQERHAIGWKAVHSLSQKYIVLGNSAKNKTNVNYSELETITETVDAFKCAMPDKRFLVMVDAFDNIMTRQRGLAGLELEAHVSRTLSEFSNKYQTPIFLTSHVRKSNMRRPSLEDLKGAGNKGFDAMMIMGIYNDVSREGAGAEVYWQESTEEGLVKRPILEVNVVKNKFNDKKGVTFFYFYQDQGRVEECPQAQQMIYRNQIYA